MVPPKLRLKSHRPGHLGHGVVGGVGEELPDREHGVRHPLRLAFDPELVEGADELDDGERGVVAPLPRRRPGVAVPAGAAGVRKARVAADGGRDPDRQALADQHRPLLDVELEEGPGVRGGNRRRRCGAKRFHVHPDLRHVLGEGTAGVVAAQPVDVLDRQRSDREAAPDVGDPVPDALLAAEPRHRQVAGGHRPEVAERGEGHESGDHPREAVVVPPGGDRIEVRAGQHFGGAAVRARQCAPEVPRDVVPDLEPGLPGRLAHDHGRPLVLVAPRGAGHPDRVGRRLPDRLEQAVGEGEPRLDGGGESVRTRRRHGRRSARQGKSTPPGRGGGHSPAVWGRPQRERSRPTRLRERRKRRRGSGVTVRTPPGSRRSCG